MVTRLLIGILVFHTSPASLTVVPGVDDHAAAVCKDDAALQVLTQLLDYLYEQPYLIPPSEERLQSVLATFHSLEYCSPNPINDNLIGKWTSLVNKDVLVIRINKNRPQLDSVTKDPDIIGKNKLVLVYEVALYDKKLCDIEISGLIPAANVANEALSNNVCNNRPVLVPIYPLEMDEETLLLKYTSDLTVFLIRFLESHYVPHTVVLDLILNKSVDYILTLIDESYEIGHGTGELIEFQPRPDDFKELVDLITHLIPTEENIKIVKQLNIIFPGLIEFYNLQPSISVAKYKLYTKILKVLGQFISIHDIPREYIIKIIENKRVAKILDFIVQIYDNPKMGTEIVEGFKILPEDREIIHKILSILPPELPYKKYIDTLEIVLSIHPLLNPTPIKLAYNVPSALYYVIKLLEVHKVSPDDILNRLSYHSLKDILLQIVLAFDSTKNDTEFKFKELSGIDYELIVEIWKYIPKTEEYLKVLKYFDEIFPGMSEEVMLQNKLNITQLVEFDLYMELYKLLIGFLKLHNLPSSSVLIKIFNYEPKNIIYEILFNFRKDKISTIPDIIISPEYKHILDQILIILPELSNVLDLDVYAIKNWIQNIRTEDDQIMYLNSRKLITDLLKFLETHNVPHIIAVEFVLNRPVEEILDLLLTIYQTGAENSIIPGFIPRPDDAHHIIQILLYLAPTRATYSIIEKFERIFPNLMQIYKNTLASLDIKQYKTNLQFIEIYRLATRFFYLHGLSFNEIPTLIDNYNIMEILELIIQFIENPKEAIKVIPNFTVMPEDVKVINELLNHIPKMPAYEKYIQLLHKIAGDLINSINEISEINNLPLHSGKGFIIVLLKIFENHNVSPDVILNILSNYSLKDTLLHIALAFDTTKQNKLFKFTALLNDFKLILELWKYIPKTEEYLKVLKHFDEVFPGIYKEVTLQNKFSMTQLLEFEHYMELYKLFIDFLKLNNLTSSSILTKVFNYEPKDIIYKIVFNFREDKISMIPGFIHSSVYMHILDRLLMMLPELSKVLNLDVLAIQNWIQNIQNQDDQIMYLNSGKLITELLKFLETHNVPHITALELVLNRPLQEIFELLLSIYQSGDKNNVIPGFSPQPDDAQHIIQILLYLPPNRETSIIIEKIDRIFPNLMQIYKNTLASLDIMQYKTDLQFIEIYRLVTRLFYLHGLSYKEIPTLIGKRNIKEVLELIIQVMKNPKVITKLVPNFIVIPEDVKVINKLLNYIPHRPAYKQFIILLKQIPEYLIKIINARPDINKLENNSERIYTNELIVVLLQFLEHHKVSTQVAIDLILQKSVTDILNILLYIYNTNDKDVLFGFTPQPNDLNELVILLNHVIPSVETTNIVKEFTLVFPGLAEQLVQSELNPKKYTLYLQLFEVYKLFMLFLRTHSVPDQTIKDWMEYMTLPQALQLMIYLLKHPHNADSVIPNFKIVHVDRNIVKEMQSILLEIPSYMDFSNELDNIYNALEIPMAPTTEIISPARPSIIIKYESTPDWYTVLTNFLISHNVPQVTTLNLIKNKSVTEIIKLIHEAYKNPDIKQLKGFTPQPNDSDQIISLLSRLPPTKEIKQFVHIIPGFTGNVILQPGKKIQYKQDLNVYNIYRLFIEFFKNHGVADINVSVFIERNSFTHILDYIANLFNNPDQKTLLMPSFKLVPEDRNIIQEILKNLFKLPKNIYENYVSLFEDTLNRLPNSNHKLSVSSTNALKQLMQFLESHNISRDNIVELLLSYSFKGILSLVLNAYREKKHLLLMSFTPLPNDSDNILKLFSHLPPTPGYLSIFQKYEQIYPGITQKLPKLEVYDNYKLNKMENDLEVYKVFMYFLQTHHATNEQIANFVLQNEPKQVIDIIITTLTDGENSILPEDKDILNQLLFLISQQPDTSVHTITVIKDIITKIDTIPEPFTTESSHINQEENNQKTPLIFDINDTILALINFLLNHNVPEDISREIVLNNSFEATMKLILQFYQTGDNSILIGYTAQPDDFQHISNLIAHIPRTEEILLLIRQMDFVFPGVWDLFSVPIQIQPEIIETYKWLKLKKLFAKFLYLHGMPFDIMLEFLDTYDIDKIIDSIYEYINENNNRVLNMPIFKVQPQDLDIFFSILNTLDFSSEYTNYIQLIKVIITNIENKLQNSSSVKYNLIEYLKYLHVPDNIIEKLFKKYSMKTILEKIIHFYKTGSQKGKFIDFIARPHGYLNVVDIKVPPSKHTLTLIQMHPDTKEVINSKPVSSMDVLKKLSDILHNHGVPNEKIQNLLNMYDGNVAMFLMNFFYQTKLKYDIPSAKPTKADISLITDIVKILQADPRNQSTVEALKNIIKSLVVTVNQPDKNSVELRIKNILEKFLLNHNVSKVKIYKLFSDYKWNDLLNIILDDVKSFLFGLGTKSSILTTFKPKPNDPQIFGQIIQELVYVSFYRYEELIMKIQEVYPEIVTVAIKHNGANKFMDMHSIVALIQNFFVSEQVPVSEAAAMLNNNSIKDVLTAISVKIHSQPRKNEKKLKTFEYNLKAALKNYPQLYNIVFGSGAVNVYTVPDYGMDYATYSQPLRLPYYQNINQYNYVLPSMPGYVVQQPYGIQPGMVYRPTCFRCNRRN